MTITLFGFVVLLLALLMVISIIAGFIDKTEPRWRNWWGVALICMALLILIAIFAKGSVTTGGASLFFALG